MDICIIFGKSEKGSSKAVIKLEIEIEIGLQFNQ